MAEKFIKIYKSAKDRKSVLLPPELHRILKFEAAKQGKKLRIFLIEIIKEALKI